MTVSIWRTHLLTSLAVSADFSASLRISSATTEKPLCSSPVRDASMAAFSARRFVWSAMSLILARAATILSTTSWIPRISSMTFCTMVLPLSENCAVVPMVDADFSVDCEMLSMAPWSCSAAAVTCSMPAAWLRAPSDTVDEMSPSLLMSWWRLKMEAVTMSIVIFSRRLARRRFSVMRLSRSAEE